MSASTGPRFITFEGIDGAGKSTQIAAVADWLRARGIDPVITREPGGTPLGEQLRELILGRPMDARSETLLMFAARAEHLARVIEPALAAGRWVLCDRYTDATFAYQCGGRGVPHNDIELLALWVHPGRWPDATVLFDVAPGTAAQRLASARPADRFESESCEFFTRVRDEYLARAAREPERFIVVDAEMPPAAVTAEMLEELAPRLGWPQ